MTGVSAGLRVVYHRSQVEELVHKSQHILQLIFNAPILALGNSLFFIVDDAKLVEEEVFVDPTQRLHAAMRVL
jgi:hypothetical protein